MEFCKDGGWGIADAKGVVLVKNHLTQQPSTIKNLSCGTSCINSPYRIIQDRDTMKYGVLSYESFRETIYCNYDKIEVVCYNEESEAHFYIKVKKGNKWGCFDEKCTLVVDCVYDDIQIVEGFLECTREGEYLLYDILKEPGFDSILVGKKDLYNGEGILLIGGYDYLNIFNDCFLLYFGTTYESYDVEELDFNGNPFNLSQLRINCDNSLCLVLDKKFETIIRNDKGFYRVPIGTIYNSIDELKRQVSTDLLLRHRVDLTHLQIGFIYLYNCYGEQYFIPKHIERGFDSPEEMDNYVFDLFGEIPNDRFVDDTIVTILRINENRIVEWRSIVNEINITDYFHFLYRKDTMIGTYDENGLQILDYNAITLRSYDGRIYMAKIEALPNHLKKSDSIAIEYYMKEQDHDVLMENKQNFYPSRCKWFPYNFANRYFNDSLCDYQSDCVKDEWTDEDGWDAMTDGMYGEYPGSGWEMELFGY